MAQHPKIQRVKITMTPAPPGKVYALCQHCNWGVGPVTQPVATERVDAHREDHRAGRITATRIRGDRIRENRNRASRIQAT